MVWGILQLLAIFYLGMLGNSGNFKIESDLLKLIPEIGHDAEEQKALTHFSKKLSRKMVFLLDEKEAVGIFAKTLSESTHFSKVKYKIDFVEESKKLNSYYRKASLVQLKKYQSEKGELNLLKLGKENLRKIYSPQSSLYSSSLKTDPFLLFSRQLQDFESLSRGKIKQDDSGFLYVLDDERKRYLVLAKAAFSSFSSVGQEKLRTTILLAKSNAEVKLKKNINLDEIGALPFAEVAQKTGKRDAQNISIVSLICLALLIIFYFKRGVYFIAIVSSLFSGVTAAVLISHLVYGELHLFTLAFGASLIGVTVDYSFHYFAFYQESEKWSHKLASEKIGSALIMGFVTSLMAYGALLIPDFPGIRSIALFSVVGLSASFATVYLLYPLLFSRLEGEGNSTRGKVPSWSFSKFQGSLKVAMLLCIAVGSLAGASFLNEKNNDVKSFSFVPKALEGKDKSLRKLISDIDSSVFVLVKANSEDELLETLKSTKKHLIEKFPELMTRDFSDVGISEKSWLDIRTAIENLSPDKISEYEQTVGLKQGVMKTYLSSLSTPPAFGSLALKKADLFSEYADMVLSVDDKYFGALLFQGATDFQKIASELKDLKGSSFIHRAGEASKIMDHFYKNALWMTLVAYVIIAVLVALWTSIKDSFLIISVPLAAVGLSWILISLIGMETNIFTVFSSILLLGIGIDYSIFFNRASSGESHVKRAVFFSGVTSMIAFGLLSFSSFPALQSFGIVMLLGLIIVYLLAPFAQNEQA